MQRELLCDSTVVRQSGQNLCIYCSPSRRPSKGAKLLSRGFFRYKKSSVFDSLPFSILGFSPSLSVGDSRHAPFAPTFDAQRVLALLHQPRHWRFGCFVGTPSKCVQRIVSLSTDPPPYTCLGCGRCGHDPFQSGNILKFMEPRRLGKQHRTAVHEPAL